MNCYTARYESGEDKAFWADTKADAESHAKEIGCGRRVESVRESTVGELSGLEGRYKQHCEALRNY